MNLPNHAFLGKSFSKRLYSGNHVDFVPTSPYHLLRGYYLVVTTDFDLKSAKEFLSDALPFLDDMAIIEIDPNSFG